MNARHKYNKQERIGRLNTLVTIQSYTETVNAFGERAETWTTLATVWANVDDRLSQSSEVAESGQETIRQRVDFTIRNLSTVNEQNRISAGNKIYDIESIMTSDDNQFMTLQTRRVK